MFRAKFPQLYELRDCLGNSKSPDRYFQNFDENLANFAEIREAYLRTERMLQELDAVAWKHLKTEAIPYLERHNKKRSGWEQLFNILNEARAYRYLKSIGCSNLRFIPRSNVRTPDLEGVLVSNRVLCEVKTINPSDEEIALRTAPPTVRSLPIELTPAFFKKLRLTIDQAERQISAHDRCGTAIHFVYLNIFFDEFFAECKEAYLQQIDACLAAEPLTGLRLVICNEHTLFYKPLQMLHATVDNIG